METLHRRRVNFSAFEALFIYCVATATYINLVFVTAYYSNNILGSHKVRKPRHHQSSSSSSSLWVSSESTLGTPNNIYRGVFYPKIRRTMSFMTKKRKAGESSTELFMSSSSTSSTTSSVITQKFEDATKEMNSLSKTKSPFTDDELDSIILGFEKVLGMDDNNNNNTSTVNLKELRALLGEVGHLNHKEWQVTGKSAERLASILLCNKVDADKEICNEPTPSFRQSFQRVMEEGNWDGAVSHAQQQNEQNNQHHPWAILVTGVNGIRKTTSVYQPWFHDVLNEALQPPSSPNNDTEEKKDESLSEHCLPTGKNSFFRQLDHMIATIANQKFRDLYLLSSEAHDFLNQDPNASPPPDSVIKAYSDLKAEIFTRYRTASEILGVVLVRMAIAQNINIMIETSGRDVAMFEYIQSFFPLHYNKLALRFVINDISCAEKSVDSRMIREMKEGVKVVLSKEKIDDNSDTHAIRENTLEIIRANAGGPYGSSVLRGVQADSDKVWKEKVMNDEVDVGNDWYKACIQILANKEADWQACAIQSNGELGTKQTFIRPDLVEENV